MIASRTLTLCAVFLTKVFLNSYKEIQKNQVALTGNPEICGSNPSQGNLIFLCFLYLHCMLYR
jgi:hypothetical protein